MHGTTNHKRLEPNLRLENTFEVLADIFTNLKFSKIIVFCLQALRPFLVSCQNYLALLGLPQSEIMNHVGMFISLSSELAVAASPLHYRLSRGQLYLRMTIKELQVPMKSFGFNQKF